jgi:hypothetical protein
VGLPSELVDLIRDGRLHDARHTAATPLLILGVPERAVMGLMGWSTTAMAARHQHITGSIRGDVAQRVGGPIRGSRVAGGTATGTERRSRARDRAAHPASPAEDGGFEPPRA